MDFPHHYSLAKIFKNILAALACIYLFSFNVFAADIHSIPHQTIGYANFEDAFPYGFIKLYEMHFLNVPDYLIEYHKKVGGTVTFTTEDLNQGKFGNSNILGLYNIETHKIEIKLDPFEILKQKKGAYSTPAHEYGHFLYHITKDTWTEDMYDALHDEFVKRSKTNSTVVNQDEAFA